ncbi:MAG: hypothetical protein QM730_02220 [Anaerolineales bacterium]
MKRVFLALALFSWMISSCTTATPTPDPLPVVSVDQQHMTTAGLEYQIPAGSGFVLDASAYDFGSSTPMAVQVVTGNFFYQTDWAKNAVQQTILVSDLQPLFNAKPLAAFSAGQQLIVSIGSLSTQGRFKPIWVGVVNVK